MKLCKENTEKQTHIHAHTHMLWFYEAFCPSKPGQNKCRESSKKPLLYQQMLKARSCIESKWDVQTSSSGPKQIQAKKYLHRMTEKQRKAVETNFLFKRDMLISSEK